MKALKFIVLLLWLMGICGCATMALKPEQIQKVKTIAVVVEPYRNKPVILNHTSIWRKSYTNGQSGSIVGLLKGLVLSAEVASTRNNSLGGSPKNFLETLKDFQIQKDFDAQMRERLSTGFQVITTDAVRQGCKTEENERCSAGDYLESAGKLGADAFIYLKYFYGLAYYLDDNSSAVIDADLWIYDAENKKVLLKKRLSSEEFCREGHAIDDFLKDDATLFKNQIMKAEDGLAKQVSAEWALFKDEVETQKSKFGVKSNYFTRHDIPCEEISSIKASCNWPVRLTKKCSIIWGATQGVKINNRKGKIAATADGKVILGMWGSALIMTEDIIKVAEENQIKILRANIFNGAGGEGFILYTDGDLFSALRKYFY